MRYATTTVVVALALSAAAPAARITIYSDDAGHVATCKYKYKRVDTTNPNLTYSCT